MKSSTLFLLSPLVINAGIGLYSRRHGIDIDHGLMNLRDASQKAIGSSIAYTFLSRWHETID
jgi:hypothetical protein